MPRNLDPFELLKLLQSMADEHGEVRGYRKDLYEPLGVEEDDIIRGTNALHAMGYFAGKPYGEYDPVNGSIFNVTLAGYPRS